MERISVMVMVNHEGLRRNQLVDVEADDRTLGLIGRGYLMAMGPPTGAAPAAPVDDRIEPEIVRYDPVTETPKVVRPRTRRRAGG